MPEDTSRDTHAGHEGDTISFVTFEVAGQMFGVPVTRVQDILTPDAIAPVPGGPAEVQGLINLRGRIVTVIDLRTRLGLKRADGNGRRGMCVTVENDGESYTLYVDRVGDVVTLPASLREDGPATLDTLDRIGAPGPLLDTARRRPAAAGVGPANRVLSTTELNRYLIRSAQGDGITAEQYRALRTRILRANIDRAVHTMLVTSPGRREGKSLTVANLGLTMAQDDQRRICILDADFRAPDQHRLFGLPEGPGLSDVLPGRTPLEEALVTITDHHITVLPAGSQPNRPAELLGTAAMGGVLDTLRSRFDGVIIDAPAAAPLADIGVLMPLVDSVLLVVRAGVTLKPAIHDAVGTVDPDKFIGFVLNDAA